MEGSTAPPTEQPVEEPLANGQPRPLDRRFISVSRLVSWIMTAFVAFWLLAGTALFVWLAEQPAWVELTAMVGSLSFVLFLCLMSHLWPAKSYRHRSWTLSEEGLEIRTGVWWRHVQNVPRSRVQHTDVNQGPIDRAFGLATLIVHTAGTLAAAVPLDGLDRETAERIRDHLVATDQGDAV